MTNKSSLKQVISDFRTKHFLKEMNKNLKVAREIRDDTAASAKNRNDAVKIISRMMGSLAPEKVASSSSKGLPKKQEEELTEEDKLEIENLING